MSTADHAKSLATLLKKIRSAHELPELVKRPPLDELVFSILLWEATVSKAEHALKRLNEAFVDHNDMRVSRPAELGTVIGKLYPRVEERCTRLHAVLSDIYRREHNVTLEPAMKLNKRDAAKYLETLSGIPAYSAARVQLVCLESHHMPVDDRMLSRLIAAGVVDEGSDVERAMGILNRHVKHEDALDTYRLLQAWSEEPAADHKPAPRRSEDSKKKVAPAKAGSKKVAASRH